MLLQAWITSVVLTFSLLALALVADYQRGECFDGDPIPNCPKAGALAEWGYFIGGVFWVVAAVCLLLTLTAVWRRIGARAPTH